ncbi:MAG: ABC transporter permease [Lentisphaeria bacterium]|nr:ABC transporter permease [Lentisphaeria bacterium]
MWHYLLKRLILGIITLFVILAISYFLLRLAPGDPTRSNMFSMDSSVGTVNSEKGEFSNANSIRKELYLDKPILYGFVMWFGKVVTECDFGRSVTVDPGRPVMQLIMDKLPVTLYLNLLAIILTYMIAIPSGIISGSRINGFFDKSSSLIYFILYSLPGIWIAILLQVFFCEGGKFPIFPLSGIAVENSESLSTWEIMGRTLFNSVLPVICLSYGAIASLSRYARSSMAEVMNQEYIRTARAKGASEFTVVTHHAFRNSVISLITLFSGILPSLIAGSVIVEYVFNIQGMGNLSLLALSSRDYPLQMALFFMTTFLSLLGLLIADILYMLADPRIKLN